MLDEIPTPALQLNWLKSSSLYKKFFEPHKTYGPYVINKHKGPNKNLVVPKNLMEKRENAESR
jgi:hypothetical protein